MLPSFIRRLHLHEGAFEGLFLVILGCLGIIERSLIASALKSRYQEPLSADKFLFIICIALILGGVLWGIVSRKAPHQTKLSQIISPTFLKATFALIGYLLIMRLVGFYFSTIIFLLLLFQFCSNQKWLRSLLLSLGLASFFYVLFS